MKTTRTWQGVRMRRVTVGADPDAPMRLVTLPAAWDDVAAAALAGLAPGEGPVMLAAAADAWIRPVAERARRAGLEAPLAERLHRMLLLRHGAPSASVWQGQAAGVPGFVLNLAIVPGWRRRVRCARVCRGGGDRGHRADLERACGVHG